MQHARISVKHLTTVLMLAAKLIQSGSVVNTGIWTKPRQPGMANSPTAGSCRAAPLQGLLKPLLQAWVPWERGWQLLGCRDTGVAAAGPRGHGDSESCRAAKEEGLKSRARATSPGELLCPQPHGHVPGPRGTATPQPGDLLSGAGGTGQTSSIARAAVGLRAAVPGPGRPGGAVQARSPRGNTEAKLPRACNGTGLALHIHSPPCFFYLYFSNLLITLF